MTATDRELGTPWKVTFVTNELCNLRCRHCYSWKSTERRTLSTRVILDAVAELAEWVGRYKLFIAGGEPTLRKDLAEIVRVAADGGCMVSMATNGTQVDARMAEALVRAGLRHVDVSLDSLDPEVHDTIRGRRGATAGAKRAIELLHRFRRELDSDLSMNIAAVVCAYNYRGLPDLARWVAAEGLGNLMLQPVVSPFWSSYDRGWLMRSDLWPRDTAAVQEVIDELVAIKRSGGPIDNAVEQLEGMREYFAWAPPEGEEPIVDAAFVGGGAELKTVAEGNREVPPMVVLGADRSAAESEVPWGHGYVVGDPSAGEMGPRAILPVLDARDAGPGVLPQRIDRCQIGHKVLNINSYGDVRLCHDMPAVGNLTRQSLREIWTSSRANQLRELIAHCHEGCYLLNCNFCD